jgi:hypothetical protein
MHASLAVAFAYDRHLNSPLGVALWKSAITGLKVQLSSTDG